MEGNLIEGWELNAEKNKVTMHVRPGIHWAADDVDWMENRELTAEDIADDINRFRAAPWGNRFDGKLKDVYATDKYTFVVEFVTSFSTDIFYYFCWEDRSVIAPPELYAVPGRAEKWANQVGTGPFMFEEYVPGSHMSYKRNPNYWGKATIDGVEYQRPFIDRLVYPIIPDQSTQTAALRTGTLDFHRGVSVTEWETLEKTAPALRSAHYSSAEFLVALRCDVPPFDNKNVRRAMMIGTNLQAFKKLGLAEDLPTHSYPLHYQCPAYIPLEELPAEAQILYDYNPTLAKQMLADEGYTDGLKISLYCSSAGTAPDHAALIKDQWAKFGVEVNIVQNESAVHTTFCYERNYKDAALFSHETSNPINALVRFGRSTGYCNFGNYVNPDYDELVDELQIELDTDKQVILEREASLVLLEDVAPYIPLYAIASGHFWWPWLQNYYGELTCDDGSIPGMLSYVWVDEDMKKEMGY